ncbi:hypothetical protein [Mesorhizobium sp. M9A.F.Ca.ET.002.03.1.2]|uniref:hypothetical protein n=1 Tax=Mesorhizobium sp. M9A.F.Ca.ET.002.03.1.2 TaxID=2493668 RepID=UPI0016791AF5|nr:hypothetical protein [Mesorhizobium sp. M9A.F.Ca.ET.002.03.1.2]
MQTGIIFVAFCGADDLVCPNHRVEPGDLEAGLLPTIAPDCNQLSRALCHLKGVTKRMSMDRFPVGLEMDVTYSNFQVSLTLMSTSQLKFEIKEGPFARIERVDIQPAISSTTG